MKISHKKNLDGKLCFNLEICNLQSAIYNSPSPHPSPRGGEGKGEGSGFTLIEIMVVVIILGILAAIVAPRLISRTDDARVVEGKIQIKNFETALKLFKMDNGFYPSTEQGLDALISKPTTGRIPKNYKKSGYLEKKRITLDPWGNPYIYISPGIEGDYDIICYGADGEPGGEGYDADITNWDM